MLELVADIADAPLSLQSRPTWLDRPGRVECGWLWPTVDEIYADLSDGLVLPDEMPALERRRLDAIVRSDRPQIIEFDGNQHFNVFRALTLDCYPADAPIGFPRQVWADARRHRIPGISGGWGAPKPPLFPMAGGRHRQRAFRDALTDLLPPLHDFGPTVRIAEFEVRRWAWGDDALARMAELLNGRLVE